MVIQDSSNLHFVEDRREPQGGAGLQTVPVVEGVEGGCLAVAGGPDRPFATAEGRYKTPIGVAALTVNRNERLVIMCPSASTRVDFIFSQS